MTPTRPLLRPALACCALGLLLSACGGARVRVPILRPAEINLAEYKTLALSEFTGSNSAGMLAGRVEERLMEGGRFEVVDRTHMGSVMNELQLSASDLAAQGGTAKLGQLVTAGALITCQVEERYTETPHQSDFTDNKGVRRTRRWITGELLLRANFKLIDVATGKLLLARSIESKQDSGGGAKLKEAAGAILGSLLAAAIQSSAGSVDSTPNPPDRVAMERDAREEIVDKFVGAISPRKDFAEVTFAREGDFPQMEAGIGWAQRGEWKKAQGVFDEVIRAAENDPRIDSKKLAKAYRNAGLARVYAAEYGAGMKLLQKGYELSADPELLAELDNAKRLESDARRLVEQGVK